MMVLRSDPWVWAVVPAIGLLPVMRHPALSQSAPPPAQAGAASFYGPREAGRTTASGEPLKLNRMTAASPSLPLGTRATVTNQRTGQSAEVVVNDRGPYAKGRVLDVTPKVASTIGITKKEGVAPVTIVPTAVPPPH